jgi:hypothetical protein
VHRLWRFILPHQIEFASVVLLFRSSPRYPERFPIRCLQPAPLLPAEYLFGVPPIAEAAHRSPRKILRSAKGSSAETEVVVEASILYAETYQLKYSINRIKSADLQFSREA